MTETTNSTKSRSPQSSTVTTFSVPLMLGVAPGMEPSQATEDSLMAIDVIVDGWSSARREAVEGQLEIDRQSNQFREDFRSITTSVIRPAMQQVIDRLRMDGGGGVIEEHKVDVLHKLRVTLWMALAGEIVGSPHQDRNPFLQLDADIPRRRIDVWEGDMVEKRGTSRATSPWNLAEVTPEAVTERIVDILRRAASHEEAA